MENNLSSMNEDSYTILKNYKTKKETLPSAVEVVAYDRLMSYKRGEDAVDVASNALRWTQKLGKLASSSLTSLRKADVNDMSSIKKEQYRLRVLNYIGWVYQGTFYPDNEDASGYPELAFNIIAKRDENEEDLYYYEVTYGIVHGFDSDTIGSYTNCMTLEEAWDSLVQNLDNSGRKEYIKLRSRENLNNALASRVAKEKRKNKKLRKLSDKEVSSRILGSMNASKRADLRDYIIKSAHDQFAREIMNEANAAHKYAELENSADISAFPDFIDRFLIPAAQDRKNKAIRHQQDTQRAESLRDAGIINLDDGIQVIDDDMELAEAEEHVFNRDEFLSEFLGDDIEDTQEQDPNTPIDLDDEDDEEGEDSSKETSDVHNEDIYENHSSHPEGNDEEAKEDARVRESLIDDEPINLDSEDERPGLIKPEEVHRAKRGGAISPQLSDSRKLISSLVNSSRSHMPQQSGIAAAAPKKGVETPVKTPGKPSKPLEMVDFSSYSAEDINEMKDIFSWAHVLDSARINEEKRLARKDKAARKKREREHIKALQEDLKNTNIALSRSFNGFENERISQFAYLSDRYKEELINSSYRLQGEVVSGATRIEDFRVELEKQLSDSFKREKISTISKFNELNRIRESTERELAEEFRILCENDLKHQNGVIINVSRNLESQRLGIFSELTQKEKVRQETILNSRKIIFGFTSQIANDLSSRFNENARREAEKKRSREILGGIGENLAVNINTLFKDEQMRLEEIRIDQELKRMERDNAHNIIAGFSSQLSDSINDSYDAEMTRRENEKKEKEHARSIVSSLFAPLAINISNAESNHFARVERVTREAHEKMNSILSETTYDYQCYPVAEGSSDSLDDSIDELLF